MMVKGFPGGIDPAVGRAPPQKAPVIISMGVLLAIALYLIGDSVQGSYTASFFAAPFFVGMVVGLFSLRHPFLNSFITLMVALMVGVVTLREGVVCVLYSLPLLVPEVLAGAACAWILRRFVRGQRNHYFIAALAVFVGVGWQVAEGLTDDPARHPVHAATSTIELAAPPERVFAALTERPIEVSGRWPWFLRLGLPMPRRMQLVRPGPEGLLRIDFSQGVGHGHVTRWEPGRALAFAVDRYEIHDLPFHITRLGRGPHWGLRTERVDDWLTLLELRYQLAPAPGGGTYLTRSTTWRRHLAPGFYFGFLQQRIMERGQGRLLELLRTRVPSEPPQYLAGEGQRAER